MSAPEGDRRRLLRLETWLIRAVIPIGVTGAYVLYAADRPVYAGRSDRNLQGRLISHARAGRADFFDFDVYTDARKAYDVECANYHALREEITNLVHPALPWGETGPCVFCGYAEALEGRISSSVEFKVEHPAGSHPYN